jgi:hypothetical protein
VILLLSIGIGSVIDAQVNRMRMQIKKAYKEENLSHLKSSLKTINRQDSIECSQFTQRTGKRAKVTKSNGRMAELRKVSQSGVPLYYLTTNMDAAQSTNTSSLWTGGDLGLNLNGEGMTLGEWDGGGVRTTHTEFEGRVTIGDGVPFVVPNMNNRHATHVAGTMVAAGTNDAKGMAPKASLITHNWMNDDVEMIDFASEGYLLSNHSYGLDASELPEWYFGYYDEFAQSWDNISYNAPYYLIVCAAGNDHGYNPDAGGQVNPSKNGFDLMTGASNAKNILLVGSVNDIVSNDVQMSDFSSWGPTDDGRIKPDICGNGWGLESTSSVTNINYEVISGTSMAAPNVTGSLTLLQQLYQQEKGAFMKASTLKGLAIHTAREAGVTAGPDYKFGWGVLDAKEAGNHILNEGSVTVIEELKLTNNEVITHEVSCDGSEPLKVTICWTDPAAVPGEEGVVDNPESKLINDLDIRVKSGDNEYLPWILDPSQPNKGAVTGDNVRDNTEQILIPEAMGNYTIEIKHKNELTTNEQAFSLLISGIASNPCTKPAVPINLKALDIKPVNAVVGWEGEYSDLKYELRYKELGETEWNTVNDLGNNSYYLDELIPSTEYELQVRSFCQDSPSEYSSTYYFSTSACESPTNINAMAIENNSISLTWNEVNGVSEYTIEYQGYTDEWKSITTIENSVTLNQLESGTLYSVKLRSDCSDVYTSSFIEEDFITDCLPVTELNITNITSGGVWLEWDNIVGIQEYNLRYRLKGTSEWNMLTFENNEGAVEELMTDGEYEFEVRSVCNNGEVLPYQASVTCSTYCASQGVSTDNEWIDRVVIGSIDNASGNNNGYADFRALSAKVKPEQQVNIGLKSGQVSDFPKYWSVWMDVNRDGDIGDEDELLLTGMTVDDILFEKSITIPGEAEWGKTMLRVAMQYNKQSEPCGEFEYGEVEDYTLIVGNELDEKEFTATSLPNVPDDSPLITAYPNPANSMMNINLDSQIKGGGVLRVQDMKGRILISKVMDHRVELNVSQLVSGVYIISYQNDDVKLHKRFIKR